MNTEQQIPPTLLRKVRREKRVRVDDGFAKIGSLHYLEWLGDFHKTRQPQQYFEIGTESGASLSLAQCASIAVDPQFRIEQGVVGDKPEVLFFQTTSDSFFSSRFLENHRNKIEVAFLDGLHLIECLLRDFINTEKHMSADGVVLIHDCLPMNRFAASREWDKKRTRAWTGDVWKIIPILKSLRPDLRCRTLDLAPSGLLMIENLDPESKILTNEYPGIVEKYVPMSLDDYGLQAFKDIADVESVQSPAMAKKPSRWEEPDSPSKNMLRIAIKTPKARQHKLSKIVDYPFARSIANGLLAQGHAVRIDSGADWYNDTEGTDCDFLLRGRGGFDKQEGIPLVSWVIYPGKSDRHAVSSQELRDCDHVFFASQIGLNEACQLGFGEKSSLLMQCFEPSIMYPVSDTDRRKSDCVFVGSNHFGAGNVRPIIDLSLKAGVNLRIWGRGWMRTQAAPNLQTKYLSNNLLGNVYREAGVVLCDHLDSMRIGGYVSNRIFDALACGAPVISDCIQGIPEDMAPFVTTVSTPGELQEAVEQIDHETDTFREKRFDFAVYMKKHHSFDVRTAQISEQLLRVAGRS